MNKNSDDISNRFLLVVFFIVGAIFVGSVCFIAGIIYSGTIHEDEKCETMLIKDEVKESEDLYELNNENIKSSLLYKTSILLKGGNSFLFNNDIFKLSDREKISILLEGTYYDDNYLDIDNVKEEYKQLFNEDINLDNNKCYVIEKNKIINNCPRYEENYKFYVYEYLEDKDYYYVYLVFVNDDNNYNDTLEDIVIDGSNYEEYSKYKITFNKSDMYFYSLERI